MVSKEYIEREALLQTLNKEGVPYNADVNYFITNAPAVDIEAVVRCGKCKHYSKYGHCKLLSVEADSYSYGAYVDMDNDDFCSYGERKDGADNAAD